MTPVTSLYAFGSNGSGQLGVGHYEDLSEPQLCVFKHGSSIGSDNASVNSLHDKIVKIVAGGNHTLLLTETGVVYATGDNGNGQRDPSLPAGHCNVLMPVDLANRLGKITDIAATWDSSFVVVNSSKVYSFCLSSEEKGNARQSVEDIADGMLPIFDCSTAETGCTITGINAGVKHVLVVLSSGAIYGWGSCRKGQLGSLKDNAGPVIAKPIEISLPFRVAQAVVGRDYTFLRGVSGDCMLLGDTKYFTQPYDFRIGSGDTLQSGWSTVFSLQGGILLASGRGNRGQLPPPDLPALQGFAAGSEHIVARTRDDGILAWGWGEHGNCGQPVDKRGNVSERFNTIQLPVDSHETVAGVAAGCATSFIWAVSGD